MRNIFCIIFMIFILISCSEDNQGFPVEENKLSISDEFQLTPAGVKEVSFLLDRNGLMYETNQEKPYTGKYVSNWRNGQKKVEDNYRDGKKNGLSSRWFRNGEKYSVVNYKDDKFDGSWIMWDKEGNVIKNKTYSNGVLVE